jgi:hypothetical protein
MKTSFPPRAEVARVTRHRRRRAKVLGLHRARVSSRRVATSSSNLNGNANESAACDLMAMRREKRDLLKRLAEAESRAETAERARDDILADTSAIYDEGTQLWQNVWDQNDVSRT